MKNKVKAIKLLVIFLFPGFLISCGPIYDTQYSYFPPESSEGRACIFQCENSRSQCQELEHYRNQDCERRSTYDYERCRDDIRYRYDREPKWNECSESSCSADEERCDSQFRYCYQSCGGRVDAQTVCVANCQGANPPVKQGISTGYPAPTGGYQKYPRGPASGSSIYPRY